MLKTTKPDCLCNLVRGLKMFFLTRWIRKRREARQLLQFLKERQIELERRDNQQAQALLLTLYGLQRYMDPLIAAQVYNNRSCPLNRLPEELLLNILNFLDDDAITLHCLRTSR